MGLFIVEIDLKSKSPTTVENGDVIVDKGYDTITVRNVEADTPLNAEKEAISKANEFLNELSWQYGIHLELRYGSTIAPQESPATRHLKRIYIKTSLKGWHRKKVPRKLNEVITKPSDSKAYNRRAAKSQDPFDEFRNLYLAIENVASKIAIAKGKKELSEFELLEIALQECFSSNVQLLKDYSYIRSSEHEGDVIHEVANLLYRGRRCQLNHSKENEDKKVPYNSEDEWEVETVLLLTEYVAHSLLSYEHSYLLP